MTTPVDIAHERWWDGPRGWTSDAALVFGVAGAVRTLFGDGATQVAVFAVALGVSHLASWVAIRGLERAHEGVAIELDRAADSDEDPPVVLLRRPDVMGAFGR